MKKIVSGKGKFGFRYEVPLPDNNGKDRLVEFQFWFDSSKDRDISMDAQKSQVRDAKKFRKIDK